VLTQAPEGVTAELAVLAEAPALHDEVVATVVTLNYVLVDSFQSIGASALIKGYPYPLLATGIRSLIMLTEQDLSVNVSYSSSRSSDSSLGTGTLMAS